VLADHPAGVLRERGRGPGASRRPHLRSRGRGGPLGDRIERLPIGRGGVEQGAIRVRAGSSGLATREGRSVPGMGGGV